MVWPSIYLGGNFKFTYMYDVFLGFFQKEERHKNVDGRTEQKVKKAGCNGDLESQ